MCMQHVNYMQKLVNNRFSHEVLCVRRLRSLAWLLFAKRQLQAKSIVCCAVVVGPPIHSAQCLFYIGNDGLDVLRQPLLSISVVASTGFGRPTVKHLVFNLFYFIHYGLGYGAIYDSSDILARKHRCKNLVDIRLCSEQHTLDHNPRCLPPSPSPPSPSPPHPSSHPHPFPRSLTAFSCC